MIIECINCNKKFNVDKKLIPADGRQIQCGSCNHRWHYKIEEITLKPLVLDKKSNQEEQKIFVDNQSDNFKTKIKSLNEIDVKEIDVKEIDIKEIKNKNIVKPKKKTSNFGLNKLFSYLIVFIISAVALIILIDTLKIPLIDIFPRLEIILFNLFEILKDIKLFIIDLT